MPREVVEFPSLETFKSCLGMVLGNWLAVSLHRHSRACLISEKEEPMNENKSAVIIWNSAHISSDPKEDTHALMLSLIAVVHQNVKEITYNNLLQ